MENADVEAKTWLRAVRSLHRTLKGVLPDWEVE